MSFNQKLDFNGTNYVRANHVFIVALLEYVVPSALNPVVTRVTAIAPLSIQVAIALGVSVVLYLLSTLMLARLKLSARCWTLIARSVVIAIGFVVLFTLVLQPFSNLTLQAASPFLVTAALLPSVLITYSSLNLQSAIERNACTVQHELASLAAEHQLVCEQNAHLAREVELHRVASRHRTFE